MADQLPAPPVPVPADADLTDLKFMPLEVARLRRSKAWLLCKRRPELAFYMLNLWTASWHERPAGSLEDDDDVLADAAMCSPEKWTKVRDAALRGWVKHSDGRLYHPVVAEKVNDSWHSRVLWRWEKECDRIRKENGRRKEKRLPPLDFPPKPERMSASHPTDDLQMSAGIPPEKPLQGRGKVRDSKKKEVEGADAPPPAPSAGSPPEDFPDLPLKLDRSPEAEAVRLWNGTAERTGLPLVQRLTDARRRTLKTRLNESGGIEGWQAALAKVEASSFLTGKTVRTNGHENWRCDIDFILRQAKFTKLMEGGFDDTPSNTKSGIGTTLDALAEWSREGTG